MEIITSAELKAPLFQSYLSLCWDIKRGVSPINSDSGEWFNFSCSLVGWLLFVVSFVWYLKCVRSNHVSL